MHKALTIIGMVIAGLIGVPVPVGPRPRGPLQTRQLHDGHLVPDLCRHAGLSQLGNVQRAGMSGDSSSDALQDGSRRRALVGRSQPLSRGGQRFHGQLARIPALSGIIQDTFNNLQTASSLIDQFGTVDRQGHESALPDDATEQAASAAGRSSQGPEIVNGGERHGDRKFPDPEAEWFRPLADYIVLVDNRSPHGRNTLLDQQIRIILQCRPAKCQRCKWQAGSACAMNSAVQFTGKSLAWDQGSDPQRISENRQFVRHALPSDAFGGGGNEWVGDRPSGGQFVAAAESQQSIRHFVPAIADTRSHAGQCPVPGRLRS